MLLNHTWCHGVKPNVHDLNLPNGLCFGCGSGYKCVWKCSIFVLVLIQKSTQCNDTANSKNINLSKR